MILTDGSPEFTDLDLKHTLVNPIVFHALISKERNVPLYTKSHIRVFGNTSSFSVTVEKPKLKPASKRLKAAMFDLSSSVIAKSLK